jgi:hypothetical protein
MKHFYTVGAAITLAVSMGAVGSASPQLPEKFTNLQVLPKDSCQTCHRGSKAPPK